MKAADRLTVANLAANLDDVLARVQSGKEFAIERNCEVVAKLGPPNVKPSITWGEFVAKYRALPRPDDRFADDLEAILAEREMMTHGTD